MLENFKPLADRTLIKRLDAEEKTQSGLIIPDAAKEKAQIGEVIAVGPGRKDNTGKIVSMEVKEGDRVYFGKYAGTEIKDDYLIIREDEILGVLKK